MCSGNGDSMDKEKVDLAARLAAIETLLGALVIQQVLKGTLDPDRIKDAINANAMHMTFPGVDPTISDHVSAESQRHVERILAPAIASKRGQA